MITFAWLPYIFLLFQYSSDTPFSTKFNPAIQTGILKKLDLAEASGMIASKKNPGKFWVINDSGNQPNIFLINDLGETIQTYWLDAYNLDWEDLALKTDPVTGNTEIVIADIGDNFSIRKHINLIVLDEPKFSNPSDTLIKSFKNYYFKYEDGSRDAETLLFEPITSNFIIVSKREENVRVYEAPVQLQESDTSILKFKGSLPFHNVTAGDISSEGNEILLKNYNAIFYWKKQMGVSLLNTIFSEHEILNYSPEPQGESICWDLDGKGFYTLSEKSWAKQQVVYFYERNNSK